MSIFFTLLIGCNEVTPVGKRIKAKWDLPAGQGGALAVLGVFFALGGLSGCLLAALSGGEGAQELCAYLTDYLSLAEGGGLVRSLWPVLWGQFKFFLAASVLGLTALGVVGLPLLFGIRGFFFAFSVSCLCRVFGGVGLFPAFALFGLSALLWSPAFFLAGVQGLSSSQQLLRRSFGDGRGALPLDRGYWLRLAFCAGLTLAGGLAEYWVVPVLIRAAARVVL